MKCTRLVCLMAALLVASAAWAGLYDAPYEMRFTTWTTNLENWANYGTGSYTSTASSYLVPNSVSFNDQGDSTISPTIDNPDTMSVSFKGNRTTWNPGTFKIYARQGANAWEMIRECTWGTGGDIPNNSFARLTLGLGTSFRGQQDVQFKFYYEYKVVGGTTNVAMDSFTVTAYAGGDLTPPSISSITVIDNTHLDVLFNEAVDQTTAESEPNYDFLPGSINPSLATRDGGNIALVHLTFASALPSGMDTLTVNGVEDTSGNACTNATGYFQLVEAGDVIITEVMYDDTALADSEWVELHNMTGNVISIAGWYLTDDDSYPALSGEGAITIPAGTTIPANGYVVVAKSTLPVITGEIVCTLSGSFLLNNDGDNLALYSAATGGTLVDGSLTINYPDMSTPGYSIERCDDNAPWDSSASAWHLSTNAFDTGRYLYCTPGLVNSACVDTRPPEISHLLLIGDTQLDVWWDEPVDQPTAETEANYVVTRGGATPSLALRDGGNIFLVHLTFALAFPPGTDTLTVNAVEDTSSNNNACVNEWWTFASGGDLTPPGLVSVTPLSRTALDVLFNEPVELTTAETEANYTVIPGNANPTSALRDATNLALVHLIFALNLPAGRDTLNVNAVQDTSSNHNACSNVQKTFNIPLANEGDVVINEIMYDDAASGTDSEWVELYNRTASAIDISGWVILESPTYPVVGAEGGFYLPASTIIPGHGYMVVSKVTLPDITGEVVGTEYRGTWALNNTGGDNVGLYTDSVGGLRIDGYATTNTLLYYPDWSPSNTGVSLEKCVEDSPWPADSTGWHLSTNLYSTTGRFRFCTPGATNSSCADTVRPTLVSATVVTMTILDVVFSEPVDTTTAETVTNYSVNNGVGNPASATRQTAQNTVRLGFTNPLPVGTDTLTVNNVTDPASNAILPNSKIAFTVVVGSYNIVITEVMPDPGAVLDNLGEWFEIHNGAGSAVDMTGWQITDGEGTHTLTSPATINADQYFVFCVNGDAATNGGVPENYVYPCAAGTGMQLNNVADDITLKDGAGVIVAWVAYTTAFHWGTGSSMQLRNLAYNPAFDTSWCAADTVWAGSMGDAGTPGAASICPGPPDTVTICSVRVQDTCGVPTLLNVRVVTRGVITFADTCRKTAYLQSGGCGVAIYGSAVFDTMQNSTRLMARGDSVVVEGYITQFHGLTEFDSSSSVVPVITFISSGHSVTPVDIACTDIGLLADSCRGENFEAEMVRLSNVTFINPVGNFPLADSNFAILCGSDTAYFRLDSCDTALIGTAIPTVQIHITAVLGQYDNTSCYCRGYQLLYGGGTTFVPSQCAEPESLTVIRDGMTDNVLLRWRPGAGQTCNCYEIYWAADAITVWPTGYTYLAHVVGSTTYTDVLGTPTRRFYRVTAGGPHCP